MTPTNPEPPLTEYEARAHLWGKHRLSLVARDFAGLMRGPFGPPANGNAPNTYLRSDLDRWASEARRFAKIMDRARHGGDTPWPHY